MARFPSKNALHLKEVCYKFFCVNTISDKVAQHTLSYLTVQKNDGGGRPLLAQILAKIDPPL